jgi:hypothetical protein
MPLNSTIVALIFKEISGTSLTIAEQLAVSAWENEKSSRARMLAQFRNQQWRLQEWQRYHNNKQAAWKTLQARIAKDPTLSPLPDLVHSGWVETQEARRATRKKFK